MPRLVFNRVVPAKLVTREGQWSRVASSGVSLSARPKFNFGDYTPEEYVFNHCTIIAGFEPESNGYWIPESQERFINNNGNGWTNSLLSQSYKTFVGAENFLEHIQVMSLSKGKILDAVARKALGTIYVDILVATDREHKDLVRDIQTGRMYGLSMGCSMTYSQCSFCGQVYADEDGACEHLENLLGQKLHDSRGRPRLVSELVGVAGVDGSCLFKEASWVGKPAFLGAVKRSEIFQSTSRRGVRLGDGGQFSPQVIEDEDDDPDNIMFDILHPDDNLLKT